MRTLQKNTLHVWRAIQAWSDLHTKDNDFKFAHLEAQTDGSTVLGAGCPTLPINAGWGVVFFADLRNDTKWFLAAAWGQIAIAPDSPYYNGAVRATIPVA